MKLELRFLASVLALGMLVPLTAFATNGYFAHGYGTKNKGLAGGGIALPQDTMAAATNPAGMVFTGDRFDLGAAIFSPSPRSYTATSSGVTAPNGAPCGLNCPFTIGGEGPGTQSIESDNDFFLIPHFGRNWMLNSDSSIGLTVYGNGGMDTEYKNGIAQHSNGATAQEFPGTFGAGNTTMQLSQIGRASCKERV